MDTRCLSCCKTKFVVNLHPSQALSVMAGVRSHLNSLLLRWSEDLEGVALSYTGERILSSQARIHPYFPYLELHAEAEVLMFGPKAGHALVGRVVRVAGDYLALLVLDTFNAAIARQLIPPSFRFQPGREEGQGAWVQRTDPSKRISEGSHVLFAVKRVQTEGDFFSLLGSLEPPWAGPVASPAQGDLPGSLPTAGTPISLLQPQPLALAADETNRGGPLQQQQQQQRADAAPAAAPAPAPARPADVSGARRSATPSRAELEQGGVQPRGGGTPSDTEQGEPGVQPEGTAPGVQGAKGGKKKKKKKRRREAEPEAEQAGAAAGLLEGAGQRHDRQGGGAPAAAGSSGAQVAAAGSSEPQVAPQPVAGGASGAAVQPRQAKKRRKQLQQPEAAEGAASGPGRPAPHGEPAPPGPEVPGQQEAEGLAGAADGPAGTAGDPSGVAGGKGRKGKGLSRNGVEMGSAGQDSAQAGAGKQALQKKKQEEKGRKGDGGRSTGAAQVARPENGAEDKSPVPGPGAKEPMSWLLTGKKKKKLKAQN